MAEEVKTEEQIKAEEDAKRAALVVQLDPYIAKADKGFDKDAYVESVYSYRPTGYFANRGIIYFKQFVKDGKLDEEGAMVVAGLNLRQIPLLKIELEAAGFITPAIVAALEEKKVDELKKIAERQGIDLPSGAKKDEIVETLAAQLDESDLAKKKRP